MHIIHVLPSSAPFRGSYAMLKAAVRICLHMVALKLKTVMDSDGPRNTVCGPWHHHP